MARRENGNEIELIKLNMLIILRFALMQISWQIQQNQANFDFRKTFITHVVLYWRSMSHAQCILCFKLICSNSDDRNYVRGKSNIQVEIEDLTFVVTESSDYICQKCVSLVKKRRTLKNKLAEIDESLLLQYRKGAK